MSHHKMRTLRAWASRVASLFSSRRHERDFQEELESHLQLHIDDNIRAGMSPEEARRVAVLRLGGVAAVTERQRDRRGIPFAQNLWRDVRVGLRALRANPTFTVVTVATLALAIGANTSIFTLVNAVLLRPLPYSEPDRLAMIWATDTESGDREQSTSYPDFAAWRSEAHSFESVVAITSRSVVLSSNEQSVLVPAVQTSAEFFRMLRIPPAMGRFFQRTDETLETPRAAVLSDSAWKRHFGGRGDIVGAAIRINQSPHVVIGVAPPGIQFLSTEQEQVYTLHRPETDRTHVYLRVMGRLRSGASFESAQAEMDVLTRRIAMAFPRTNRSVGANVVPLQSVVAAPVRQGLLILLTLVAVVLLIACTNVANLLLARNVAREHELALRIALGAGRGRIFQQLLVESLLVAMAGGLLALGVASVLTAGLVTMLSAGLPVPRLDGARIDPTVLAFTASVSLAAALVFGVVPSLIGAPRRVHAATREMGRAMTGSRSGRRTRTALVIAEMALALVLLGVGATLTRTFLELRGTNPGFVADNVLVVAVRLPPSLAPGAPRANFFEEVRTRVANLPGVRSAGFVSNLPMAGGHDQLGFRLVDRPAAKPVSGSFNIATPGYFRTMGIPVLAGREFVESDNAAGPAAIVINESAARRYWPDTDPIGRQIVLAGRPAPVLTVVGVTGDVRQSDLGTAPKAEIFLSALQPGPNWASSALVVATTSDPGAIVPDVRAIVGAANRDVAIGRIGTLHEVLSASLAAPRTYTVLLGAFAILALALAAVGLFGVISYSVTQRTREFGIRMALGSSSPRLVASVLKQGAMFTLAGVAIGIGGAYFAVQAIAKLVPGARPEDTLSIVVVALVMMLVGLCASYMPARRAARVDPLTALRAE